MIPKLYIDKRFTTNGTKSQIKLDNFVKMHSYIINFLEEYSKVLPIYADNTAAGVGGLTSGQMYKTATGALMFKN